MNKKEEKNFAIPRKNILLILVGLGLMVIGFVLLAGGGSGDPDVFNDEMFSTRRLVVAPLFILGGMVFEIYAIMRRPKERNEE